MTELQAVQQQLAVLASQNATLLAEMQNLRTQADAAEASVQALQAGGVPAAPPAAPVPSAPTIDTRYLSGNSWALKCNTLRFSGSSISAY